MLERLFVLLLRQETNGLSGGIKRSPELQGHLLLVIISFNILCLTGCNFSYVGISTTFVTVIQMHCRLSGRLSDPMKIISHEKMTSQI